MGAQPQQDVLAIDSVHGEHERALRSLRRALLATPPRLERARELVALLDLDLPEHMRIEELQVFPWLLKRVPGASVEIRALLREHLELVSSVTELRFALRGEPPKPALAAALRFVRRFLLHTARERNLTALALELRATTPQ